MMEQIEHLLRDKIETFLQKPAKKRTTEERKEILEAFGVKQPEKFLHSVWSTQWEAGIDSLLNPESLYFRPLDRSDINFKWAKGSFNALPPEVKAKIFLLKMKPNAGFEAIKTLLAKVNIQIESLEIKNVDILDKIHSEAAVKVVINGELERTFEISHFNLAGEEIFSKVAELSEIRKEPVHIYTTPQKIKVAFETRLGVDNLLSERWDSKFFFEYKEKILKEVAEQDAVGDALGTIARDVHYNLTESGEVYSFHHRELFHPLGAISLGFFEPIYLFIRERIGQNESQIDRDFLYTLYQVYRKSYLNKNQQLRKLWSILESVLLKMEDLIQEYFRENVDVKKVISEVKTRVFQDVDHWLDKIYEMYTEA